MRQQVREFQLKFAQNENIHGEEMRYVFGQHDQLIEEKNAAIVQLKAYAQKEAVRAEKEASRAGQL